MSIAPQLRDATSDRKVRPWLGLVVVALLLLGAFSVGEGAAWVIGQAVPHREQRP